MIRAIAKKVLTTPTGAHALESLNKINVTNGLLQSLSRPRGIFSSFEAAWEAARCHMYAGHDIGEIENHRRFASGLRISDYSVLYWLLRISERDLKIFDFGGNVGNVFYSYCPYLSEIRSLDWLVYDLPPAIEAGEQWATERRPSGLRFTRSIGPITSDRVLLISGALHYWEEEIRDLMERFSPLPDHVLINRTPIHDTEQRFYTVQVTDAYAVPCVVRNRAELIKDFKELGYELKDQWKAPELSLQLPLFPRHSVACYSGFYFALQPSAKFAA